MARTQDEVNAFLLSAGAPSAKFEKVGDKIQGFIVDAQLRDQTDFTTGKVKTYDDGNPMKQLVITVQTREQENEDDDGMRRVYARGQMLAAIRKAVGRAGMEVGGKLAVKYTGDGEATKKGFNPPKQYAAWYSPPAVEIGDDENPLVQEAKAMGAKKVQPADDEPFDFE